MKNLKRIQKNDPAQLEQIRSGRISASDALRKKPKVVARPKTDARKGDIVYMLKRSEDGDIILEEEVVNVVHIGSLFMQSGRFSPKNDAYDFHNAKIRRKEMLREGIEKMKTALRAYPKT